MQVRVRTCRERARIIQRRELGSARLSQERQRILAGSVVTVCCRPARLAQLRTPGLPGADRRDRRRMQSACKLSTGKTRRRRRDSESSHLHERARARTIQSITAIGRARKPNKRRAINHSVQRVKLSRSF